MTSTVGLIPAAGTALLLVTSNDTFEAIVPALVDGSWLLLLFQPQLLGLVVAAVLAWRAFG